MEALFPATHTVPVTRHTTIVYVVHFVAAFNQNVRHKYYQNACSRCDALLAIKFHPEAFRVMTPCGPAEGSSASKEHTASIFRVPSNLKTKTVIESEDTGPTCQVPWPHNKESHYSNSCVLTATFVTGPLCLPLGTSSCFTFRLS